MEFGAGIPAQCRLCHGKIDALMDSCIPTSGVTSIWQGSEGVRTAGSRERADDDLIADAPCLGYQFGGSVMGCLGPMLGRTLTHADFR
jgi:hypothetical protein